MTFSIALEIVLFCKNWFMSHVYLSCFDYQENYVFFLKLIQTHISVSQGSIRFEKNAKIKMLKILEDNFHLLFKMNRFSTWRKPSDRHLLVLHQIILFKMNWFFKMTQDVYPSIHGRFIETFSLKWIIFQNDANRPTLHLWALLQLFI